MSNILPQNDDSSELRKTAEGKLTDKEKKLNLMNSIDLERELNIHEIELEMQNEELQTTQVKLVESKENYTELFDFAPISYFILDIDGVIQNVNLKGCNLIGFEKKQLIGKHLSVFLNGEYCQDDYYRHRNLVIETQQQNLIESEIINHDDEILNVLIETTYLKNRIGDFKNLLTTITDISEKKKHENEILEAKERMEGILENAISSIWSVDRNYSLTACNTLSKKKFKNLYNLSIFPGVSMLEHMSFEKQKQWKSFYDKAFDGEHFLEEVKENIWDKEYYFDISFNPIWLNDKVDGVSVFVRDITDRKKTELQLKYKVNELNTFMYKATHDLRSPLASLSGLVKIAKETAEQPELKTYFNMIDTSVNRMDKLLIDLVSIVNVTQGKLTISVINFEILIDEILESLKNRPGFSSIIFKKNIKSDSLFFQSDFRLIYSVLQNIIDNAIKYRKDSSLVDAIIIINISIVKNNAQIIVSDNGIGIASELLDKVFDMFFRATAESTGTGLGLYIVKNSVEKLGGEIRIESEEKHGTSVFINLPNILD